MPRWPLPARKLGAVALFLLVTLLAACGTTGGPTMPADGSAPLAATATARSAAAPAATPLQPVVVSPAGGDVTYATGRNPDGTYFRGEPDAPVTLIVYSDFL